MLRHVCPGDFPPVSVEKCLLLTSLDEKIKKPSEVEDYKNESVLLYYEIVRSM